MTYDIDWLMFGVEVTPGCWLWKRHRDRQGYGKYSTAGKLGHRLSWELFRGEIPKGLSVLHRCDNPSCVNPDHLFLGTNNDNIADKVAKGRQAKHEGAGLTKLTQADVRNIRDWYRPGRAGSNFGGQPGFREGSQRWLAEKFKVAPSCIAQILSGKTWKGLR